MRENLIKIFLLWSVQLFLIVMFLGIIVNETLPIHIKVVIFLGLLALFESVSYQKYIMSSQKNIGIQNNSNIKYKKKHGDIILTYGVK